MNGAPLRAAYLWPGETDSREARLVQRHVELLNEAGIPAALLRRTGDADLAGAVVAVPGHLDAPPTGTRLLALCIDPSRSLELCSRPEVEAALALTGESQALVAHALPELRVRRIEPSVDAARFHPALQRRRRLIVGGAHDAAPLVWALRRRGTLDDVEVVTLENEADTAAALHDALVFVSLEPSLAFPFAAAEALASGCIVAGYAQSLLDADASYPVAAGDLLELARTVEAVLQAHPGGLVQLPPRGRAGAELVRARCSLERERATLLAAWEEHVQRGRPEITVPTASGPRGEERVELVLAAAREGILGHDTETLRAAFADPLGWDEPQRAYQAWRHLAELVLAAGTLTDDGSWADLYSLGADALLTVLERDPAEPVLLNAAGILLYELTELAGAAALFEAALELDPALEQAGENLAAIEQRRVAGAPRLERPELPGLARRAERVAAAAQPAEGLTLSLCMIVKDEEEMLPGCLEAAKDAVDEIVVVDTGSTDRTVEIAENFGAKVVHHQWNGSFADARNTSIDHATGDWILYLDADEHLADGAATELRNQLGKTWREAFYLVETNYTGGDDAGTAVAHLAMRLFRNRPGYRFEGRIHEQKTRHMPTYLPERFETTSVRVSHYGYLQSRISAREKSRRNVELLEQQAAEAPNPFTSFNLGSEHLVLGEWERAARYLDESWAALRVQPGWADIGYAPMLVARTAAARRLCGRLDDARAVLVTAIAAMPDHTDLHFELALCAKTEGRLDEADRILRHCLELGDAPPRYSASVGTGSYVALELLGRHAEERGELAEAERLYRASLAAQPAYAAPVLWLASLLLRRGTDPAALEHELPLDRARPALLAATACLENSHVAAAETLFRRVLAQQPESGAAAVGLVEALLSQRRYADAASEAAARLDHPSVAPQLAAERLFAFAAAGDAAQLDDAVAAAPPVEELELYAAWAAALAGREPQAISADAFEHALVALEALLRVQEFEAFETLHGVAAASAVPEATRRLRLGELYLRRGYLESAEDEWQAALPEPDALVGLAQVAVARGDRGLAAELARAALERAPGHPQAQQLASGLGLEAAA